MEYDRTDSHRPLTRRGMGGVAGMILAGSLLAASMYAVAGSESPSLEPQDAAAQDSVQFAGWGETLFDHEEHSDAMEIPCEDCHHETSAGALELPHPEYFRDFWIECTLCHRPGNTAGLDPSDCGDCHHDSPAGIADETLSSKVVIHRSCAQCHDIGTGEDATESCAACHDGFPE